MTNELKISGFKFTIEGDGFVRAHAEGDFEAITALVEARLGALETAELTRLHGGAIFGDYGPADEVAFLDLNRIASAACSEVTKDWHDPAGVFVTICSMPCLATPRVSAEWASSRETHWAVAMAIHAISDSSRSPQAIWEAPTKEEWDHVAMALESYVLNDLFEAEDDGRYPWGGECIVIEGDDQ